MWVSALKASAHFLPKATTPALSSNSERHQLFLTASVAATMVSAKRFLMSRVFLPSVKRMGLVKVLCLQCSDQVWAMVSTSAKVGSRRRDLKCAWMADHSRSERDRWRSAPSARRPLASLPRMAKASGAASRGAVVLMDGTR